MLAGELGALAGQCGGEPQGVAGQGTARVLTGVPGRPAAVLRQPWPGRIRWNVRSAPSTRAHPVTPA
jgi:hypothetical protein